MAYEVGQRVRLLAKFDNGGLSTAVVVEEGREGWVLGRDEHEWSGGATTYTIGFDGGVRLDEVRERDLDRVHRT